MADISAKITRKSLAAKKKAAIKNVKAEAREKIHEIKIQYAKNPLHRQTLLSEAEKRRQLRRQKRNARIAYSVHQPRKFTVGEEVFNSISHGIGAGLSVAALVLLIVHAFLHAPVGKEVQTVVAVSLFASALFVLYLMSTLYHALVPLGAKKVFSIINHVAIYLVIAASYTPLFALELGGQKGIALLALLWGVCAVLGTLYAVFGSRLRAQSVLSYVLLGWIFLPSLALMGGLSQTSRVLFVLGVAAYTVSGVFYLVPRVKWMHSVFHILALAGSILHFFAIFLLV